jgi:acyl carrier protein
VSTAGFCAETLCGIDDFLTLATCEIRSGQIDQGLGVGGENALRCDRFWLDDVGLKKSPSIFGERKLNYYREFMDNSISAGERVVAVIQRLIADRSIARTLSLNDTLAEAGLTSLDAIRLVLLVEDEFGIEIPVSELTLTNFRSISTISLLVTKLLDRT